MRTRRSNRTKRFSIQDVDYGISDDEGEEVGPSRKAATAEQADENFRDVEGNGDGQDAQDEVDDMDEEDVEDADGNVNGGSTERGPQGEPADTGLDSSYHDVPAYPQDIRATRVYDGPLRKWDRYRILIDTLYGPERTGLYIIQELRQRWAYQLVLPSRGAGENGGILVSPWLPSHFEETQSEKLHAWTEKSQEDSGSVQSQQTFSFTYGKAVAIQHNGLPLEPSASDDVRSAGWMLDIGGIPLALAWAPQRGLVKQILAMAVIPFSDQAYYATEAVKPQEDDMKAGCVQLWEFPFDKDADGLAKPSTSQPRLISAICFDWGRPRRIQWCPVPAQSDSAYGHLAILAGGQVRVVLVKKYKTMTYDWIEAPVATLGITDEHNIVVTCFTWVNVNRIALGHTDGSITLWSISPRMLLVRHPVHVNHVVDICSGYPSYPYLVASNPVGGQARLVDLSRPSTEHTFFPSPIITLQPNLLQWSDLLQGFISVYPSSSPVNTGVAFMHIKYFAVPRTIYSGFSASTSLSMGSVHPYLLVGCADGSLWASNTIRKAMYERGEKVYKMNIFQNEFRPAKEAAAQEQNDGPADRGAVRILQGFAPVGNENLKIKQFRELLTKRKKQQSGKKLKIVQDDSEIDDDDEMEIGGEDGEAGEEDVNLVDPAKQVIHEPLTRISAVACNPNIEFGWWAASAMASGLVRILDLGVDPSPVPD